MIVATVDVVTDAVEIANVALVAPAATVTLTGAVAAVLLLDSATPNPPAGAVAVNVTVPCAETPPVTLVGLTDTAESDAGAGGGVTVSVAVFVAPPALPVIVTGVDAPTALVATLNVALVAPAATVTLAGTVAAAVLLPESDTTTPPLGAAALNVAVPVDELPPTTLVGLTVTADSAGDGGGGFTPSAANSVVLPRVADSWTVVVAEGNVVIVKLALVAPAATVTLGGTVAALGRLLVNVTALPPAGAGLGSVTVPVEGLPPVTLVGLTVKEERVADGGGVPSGLTVKIADLVTPPPETEMVTRVCVVTRVVKMLNPPRVTPDGIMTLLLTCAIVGWLLVT